MPLTDWELMRGARDTRSDGVRCSAPTNLAANLYVGLEGGFHSISVDGEWHTFLRGWAYATERRASASSFGHVAVDCRPRCNCQECNGGKRELGLVIDDFAGARDVRSRQEVGRSFARPANAFDEFRSRTHCSICAVYNSSCILP